MTMTARAFVVIETIYTNAHFGDVWAKQRTRRQRLRQARRSEGVTAQASHVVFIIVLLRGRAGP